MRNFLAVRLIIILQIFFVFISQNSFSQKNYLPGYIVNSNMDTIHGLIDYKNWSKNPDQIKFLNNDQVMDYDPLSVKAFKVKNELYVGAVVDIEISSRIVGSLQTGPAMQIEKDTIFLQTLIEGPKSLYYIRNYAENDNFYIFQNGNYQILEYKKYVINSGDNKVEVENKKYTGQLVLFLNDCPVISSKIKNARYSKNDLVNLFKQYYHACSDYQIHYEKVKEKISSEFGITAGIAKTTLNFNASANEFDFLLNSNYQPTINATVGGFFKIIFPRNLGRWVLNNELAYTSFNLDGTYTEIRSEFLRTNYHSKFEYAYIKLNNMLQYRYPVNKLFLYANIGISNGFVISEFNEVSVEEIIYSNTYTYSKAAIPYTSKTEQCLVFGLGINRNRFSVETRGEIGNGISVTGSVSSSSSRLYLLMGFTL